MADFDKIKINGVPYNVKDTATAQAVAQVARDLGETNETVQQQGQQITQQGQQFEQQIKQQGQQIAQQGQTISEISAALDKGLKTVVHYGAKGDGVTDDYAAFDASIRDQGCVIVPPGTFLITQTLAIKGGSIFGYGSEVSVIKMTAPNETTSIIEVSNRGTVQCVGLSYTNNITATAQDQYLAIRLGNDPYVLQRTLIKNVKISHCGSGIANVKNEASPFSVHFDSIEITDFEYAGINLHDGAMTNNTFTNIYINNQQNEQARPVYGFRLDGWMSSMRLDSVNVERGSYMSAISIRGCQNLSVGVLHIERVNTINPYSGCIEFSGVSGHIDSISAYYIGMQISGTSIIRLLEANMWGPYKLSVGTSTYKTNSLTIDTLLVEGLNDDAANGLQDAADGYIIQRLQAFKDLYTLNVKNYSWHTYKNDASYYTSKYILSFNNVQSSGLVQDRLFGNTAERPTPTAVPYSAMYYDTDLSKLMIWNGTAWVET